MQEILVLSLEWENSMEKEMAAHSSISAWEISWTGSLAGYSPWELQGVGYDLATKQRQQRTF